MTDGRWAPQVRAGLATESERDPGSGPLAAAAMFRALAQRVGPVWQLYRDAAAVDPEIAQDHAAAQLERLRRETMAGVLANLDEQCLREGLTMDAAIDTLLVLASPATYQTLVVDRGYSWDEFEVWLAGILVAALLRPAGGYLRRLVQGRRSMFGGLCPRHQLLVGPGVAVRVAEVDEASPRLLVDPLRVDPGRPQLRECRVGVGDHALEPALRSGLYPKGSRRGSSRRSPVA